MLIVAIDPATNTGICTGNAGETPALLARRFRHGDESDEALYGNAVHFFADFLKDRKPDLIAIEEPIMATWGKTNAQTIAITRGLYAIFAGIACCKGIPLLKAPVGTWRKYALGRGNLPGDEAKRQCVAMCRRLGWPAPSHDAAEAAGIWLWACSQAAPHLAHRPEPLFARAS